MPTRIGSGPTQPSALPDPPASTSPAAIAPTTQPRKNGVISEEIEKTTFGAARPRSPNVWPKANPDPRRTIPTAASASGRYSVSMIAREGAGNAVQRTTSVKISQTWLASQTGPSESVTRRSIRLRRPRSRERTASSSQTPAPKSAPPKSRTAWLRPGG